MIISNLLYLENPMRSSLLDECPQTTVFFLRLTENIHKQKDFLKTLSTCFVYISFL